MGEHGSTYGSNPLGAAVASTALDVLIEENLIENSRIMGDYFVKGLKEIVKDFDFLKEARGRGLLMGLEYFFDF